MLRVRSPAVRSARRLARMRGHDRRRRGPRDRRRGPGGGARAAAGPRLRRAPRRTSPTMSTRFARDHRVVVFDHRGHGESDASRRRRTPTPSTGSRPTCSASPTPPASTTCGCSATRWAGWWCAGSCWRAPERVAAHRVHGHVGRPATRSRPRARGASGWRSPGPAGMAVLKRLSDELDLLGSAAYQRVLAERPGFRRVRRPQVGAAVTGDVGDVVEEIVGAARPARRAGGAARSRRS